MPITEAEAKEITIAFVRDYPGAKALAYLFRDSLADLYGPNAHKVPAGMKGGYSPRPTSHGNRMLRGRIDVPLAHIENAADMLMTLRHEVLGHYGVNTFTATEKRALLDGLIVAREEPSLKPLWAYVNHHYAGESPDMRAEEVFALCCESITPSQHVGRPGQIQQRGAQSLMETCIARIRPMQRGDLYNIACMVAEGLHDRSRTQQNFPQINALFRKDEAMEPKKPFHEIVAEKLIEQLKAGTAPWQTPWKPGEPNAYLPMNPNTGKRYKGINAIHLMSQGYGDGRWMTYKQAAAQGAQVRKGEKGTLVQYWKFKEEQDKLDADGKPVLDAAGRPIKETVLLERPRVFFASVFNAEQIDGLPPPQPKEAQTWNAIERAEHILSASGATITHTPGNRAYYRPASDSITLPERAQFPSADGYYATALHELGHWTGHASRLGRDLGHPFGSEGYAKEELRAEIASMILGDELGIGHDPGQHVAYVGSWIKTLQDDPLEVFRAAADAEKIHAYVMAFEQKQVQEQDQEVVMQTTKQIDQAAEAWVLKHVEEDTLLDVLENARVDQIDHALDILESMIPLEKENPFWARHDLPIDEDKIGLLDSRILATTYHMDDIYRPDAVVAAAFLRVKNNTIDARELSAAVSEAFDFSLPFDWTGEVRIVDAENSAGGCLLYARGADGEFTQLAALETRIEADRLADRLAVIDANSQPDEHERAVRLARVHEDRIRRDPGSTDEDISAAKENRKGLEAKAFVAAEEAKNEQATERQHAGVPLGRQYLNVPFREKEEAKQLGARWDRAEQSWFVPTGADPTPFAKWAQGAATAAVEPRLARPAAQTRDKTQKRARVRQYLAVPYGQRDAAKAAGALWDKAAKSWYVGPRADEAKLERWKPENVQAEQGPAMMPREEFAQAMRSAGLVVQGEHPIMDGKRHRVPVEGGKKGAVDGFYVGHLDGHPAGRIINNKTGADLTWKSKGYSLSAEEKAKLQAEAAEKLAQRAADQNKKQEETAARVVRQTAGLLPVEQLTPYLQAKGIQSHAGVLTDREGQKTYIPVFDADGKQWTMQYIQEDGTKRFAKDSKKEGCFHPVGGMEGLAAAPVLVVAEGYATAASLAEALGHGTVAALDSGNLPHVAQALREKYPDKPIVIAGDDDKQQEIERGRNPGRTKGEEAAQAVGGKAVFPIFAPGEQQAQRLSDFNDLANKSALGRDAVKRQIEAAIAQVREQRKEQQTQVVQHKEKQQKQRQRSVRMAAG